MVRRLSRGAAVLVLAAGLAPGTSGAAARVPRPVSRVAPTHSLIALTLRADGHLRAYRELPEALREGGAQATLFVTAREIRQHAAVLRGLVATGQVEIGLTTSGARGDSLPADVRLAERLLGDRPGVYQPPSAAKAAALAADAYRAGLVTVVWSRQVHHDPRLLAEVAKQVRAGEIVRFDLPDDETAMQGVRDAIRVTRSSGLLVTSASGLLEDASQHVLYCAAQASGARGRSAAGRGGLAALYQRAPLAARALWQLGRPGELAVRRLYGVKPGVRLGALPLGGRLPAEVEAAVRAEARRRYVAPVGATLDQASGQVVPDRPGLAVDAQETSRRIWDAQAKTRVRAATRVVHARWRTADIAGLTDVLGQYRTWIDGSSGRYMNIQKGAGRITNRIVFPGETFSTLDAIGDPTRQKGWYRAPVIVWGAYSEGVGGGLCQVSSTLYNSVARAKLKIVERHHHAKPVHYVPRGRDATIAWPDLDFRFLNDRPTPVVVKAHVRGGALWTMILGKATAQERQAARTDL